MGSRSSRKIVAQKTNSKKRGSNRGPDPSVTTLLMLCARAGGRCEFEGCNRVLFRDDITLHEFNDTNVAHIVAASPDGPRGDPKRSHELSDKIENLMLVCLEHHKLIDSKKLVSLYPEERLVKMKQCHERSMELVGEALCHDPSYLLLFTSPIKGRQKVTISKNKAVSAILSEKRPEKPDPDYIHVECEYSYHDPEYWKYTAGSLERQFRERIDNIVVQNPQAHFSVFPIAPIPLIVKLGYLMGDKIQSDVYQKRRHPDRWEWQETSSGAKFFAKSYHFSKSGNGVALIVSLSGSKSDEERELFAETVNAEFVYEIRASIPSVDCISSKEDLSSFWHVYQSTMDTIRTEHPEALEVAVLPVVPVSAAFEMGRRFMPGVYPKLTIYDFAEGFIKTLAIGE